MSKNTREANFRKVDVDELDEEQYRDDAEVEEDQSDQIGQREAEVKRLTSSYPLITWYNCVIFKEVGLAINLRIAARQKCRNRYFFDQNVY